MGLGSSDIHTGDSVNGEHLMLVQVMQAQGDAAAMEKRRETAFLSFRRIGRLMIIEMRSVMHRAPRAACIATCAAPHRMKG